MKLLIDMNLSPEWQILLRENNFEAVHWSKVGACDAPDTEIMQWARENRYVVFTHNLDFGILLAHTKSGSPSVVQVRTQDVSPTHLGSYVVNALQTYYRVLETGALLTIDESKLRVRVLPI